LVQKSGAKFPNFTDSVRLPMVSLSDKSKAAVHDAMVHAGLIN
jgi:hypothetical protein